MGVLVGNLSSGGSTDFLEAAEPNLFLRLRVGELGVGLGASLNLYLVSEGAPLGSIDFLVGLVVVESAGTSVVLVGRSVGL